MNDHAEMLRTLVPWNRDWLKPLRQRLLHDLRLGRSSVVVYLGPTESVVAHDDCSVEAVVCEHVLMWAPVPERVISEMHRVLKPGGHAVVAAEPDFGGVMEHPEAAGIQGLIAGVLRKHGADPDIGRRLLALFDRDEWEPHVHVHQPGAQASPAGEMLELMIRRVRRSLDGEVQGSVIDRWEEEVRDASAAGTLFSWVPHYALVARKR
jgi:SAM-dependent methyltransferase